MLLVGLLDEKEWSSPCVFVVVELQVDAKIKTSIKIQ